MGIQVETRRWWESTQIQSQNCHEGLPKEESSGFQLDFCPGSEDDKEVVVVITREIYNKGAPEIQHGKRETGRLDLVDKL